MARPPALWLRRTALGEYRRTIIATLAAAAILVPFYFVLIYGAMSETEIDRMPPYLIPPHPTLVHYAEAFSVAKLPLANSAIIAAGVTVLTLAAASPAAFALAKLKFRFARLVSWLMAFVQVTPMVAVVTPLFLMFFKAGFLGTYLSVILAVSAFSIPFAILVLNAHMESIPTALIEAAQIDGASVYRIFRDVALPLAMPALLTAGILVFLQGWGNFVFAVSFLQRKETQPMSVALFYFVGEYGVQWNQLMAASALYALPPVIAVALASRRLVAGLMGGALKE